MIKILGVAGGSGSGKTTFALRMRELLGHSRCIIIAQDSYYKDQSQHFDEDGGSVNFDHPAAIDWNLLIQHLNELKRGKTIDCPVYDFATHQRSKETIKVSPCPFIVVDGILILSQKKLTEIFDHTFFIDCSESVRFERRLKRDVAERGRTPDGVKAQFQNHVKPMHDLFVEPSKKTANKVVSDDSSYDEIIKNFLNNIK